MSLNIFELVKQFPEFGFLSDRDHLVFSDLQILMPDRPFRFVQETPRKNIFAVIEGASVLYFAVDPERFTRKTAKMNDYEFSFTGDFFSFDHNLTQQLTLLAGFINPDELPLEDSLTEVHGQGERTLYVFINPSHRAARTLFSTLQRIENVTIHTFITSCHSSDAGSRIMAYPVPVSAYNALMQRQLHQKQLPFNKTMQVVERTRKWDQEFFIGDEPVVFLENGMRLDWSLSEADIERYFEHIEQLQSQAQTFSREHGRN